MVLAPIGAAAKGRAILAAMVDEPVSGLLPPFPEPMPAAAAQTD